MTLKEEGDDLEQFFDEAVRAIVRDELSRWEKRKQRGCSHARSGTIDALGDLYCDDCGKLIDEDVPTPDAPGV